MLYKEITNLFDRLNVQVLGISVDGKWCHSSFREQRNLIFPLLSDFELKGNVARMYGVYNEEAGECERARFLLDESGVIQWSYLADPAINPGADGILEALDNMKTV